MQDIPLDLFDFRKDEAKDKIIVLPMGKVALVGMDHVQLQEKSKEILEMVYKVDHVDKLTPSYNFREELVRFNLLDGGHLAITPLGRLYYEQKYLPDDQRWYSNNMLDYLDFIDNSNKDVYNKKKLKDWVDAKHSREDCIKMAIFFHRSGFFKLWGLTNEPIDEVVVIEKYEFVDELLYRFHSMKQIEDILNKVIDDKERVAIFDRYILASILSGNRYYFEAITMLGSIVEHLMYQASQNYSDYQKNNKYQMKDDFQNLFKFFSQEQASVASNRKTMVQNGHYIKFKYETASLMDYRNSIHITNKISKGSVSLEAYQGYIDTFNRLCQQFKPS